MILCLRQDGFPICECMNESGCSVPGVGVAGMMINVISSLEYKMGDVPV
jgi:hypothetical protein